MRLTGTLTALLAVGAAHAQQILINDLSFGYQGRLSPVEARGKIPNFAVEGTRQPQVLSNKIILTPVSPGNQRNSIWAEKTLEETEWVADIDLRANGPERGSGNLNIWLVNDGAGQVGQNSVYTVGKFEGLALVIDAHGGSGGMLRAFLNDGSVDYGSRPNVDELAFGHCLYPYRNLGRPSQVKLRQTRDVFKVEIDGKLCFESDNVSLPTGYNFGITAATPDNPDSFEIFKLVVMADRQPGGNSGSKANSGYKYASRQQQVPKRASNTNNKRDTTDDFDDEIPDEDPDMYVTSKEQFQDLHNRLQSTNHQLSSVYRSVSRHHQLDEQRHQEMKKLVADLKGDLGKLDEVESLQKRIRDLEKEVRGLRNDVGKKMRENERFVKGYLSDHHATLSQTIADSMPGSGKLIGIFVFTQVVLVGAYMGYKRRKANSPKKYL